VLAVAPVLAQQAPELNKLFTTPEERNLINANRYRTEQVVTPQITPTQNVEVEAVQELVKEQVQVEYRISGVSTNPDGPSTAWINGQAYGSGEKMDDGSKINIRATTVIITTPDGKKHRGLSGETLDITYDRTISNSQGS
jgi:hypothetical protein